MRLKILAGSLVLALSATVMAGQVYKWVDSQGVTHFGAQPPQGQAAQSINTATAPPKPVEAAPIEPASNDESEQREIDKKVKKQLAEQAAERQRYCTTLRTNLAQLRNNPRVRVEDEGEVRRLSEEERQARIRDTENRIKDICN